MFRHCASIVCVCVVLLSLVCAPIHARAVEGVNVDYIPYDAVAAVVLHPKRVLTSPKFELWPIEVATAAGLGHIGIDPTKVERVALQNAASVSSLLLTTEALITDLPEEKPAAAPAMPHGDMY